MQDVRTRFATVIGSLHVPTMVFTLVVVALLAAVIAIAALIPSIQTPIY